ncbi:MAG: hypothetical protein HKM05_02640 [Spirochaetales bacterium]|nr:hypothetical protein [Spirochaetales bacterium]
MKLPFLAFVLGFSIVFNLQAAPQTLPDLDMTLYFQIIHLTHAQPPRIFDRKLILTYDADPGARYVAVAFASEHFSQRHIFSKNQNNVFFYVYDLPANAPHEIDYRLIVDGLWIRDPGNDSYRSDPNGDFSYVVLHDEEMPHWNSPVQLPYGAVEFRYRGQSGLRIAVMGNFNNWDPYQDFLHEEPGRPGEYSLRLSLPPGKIVYAYQLGNRTRLDPLNPHIVSDDSGQQYSYFRNVNHPAPSVMEADLPTSTSFSDQ